MEFINAYSPTMQETREFLLLHKPLTSCFKARDSNAHHVMWYGELTPDHQNSILHSVWDATPLIDWVQTHRLTLLNTVVVFTHYPISNRTPSIIDLTFASASLLNGT